MSVFANYLKRLRSNRGLTQQQVIDYLSENDTSFRSLDITTYSRWERGVTTPKISKQILVARIYKDDIKVLIDDKLSFKDAEEIFLKEYIGPTQDPYQLGKERVTLYEGFFPIDKKTSSNIISFHKNFLQLDVNDNLFKNHNVAFSKAETITGHLCGHLLYTFIPINYPDELLDLELQKSNNVFKKLDKRQTQGLSLFFISDYSPIPEFRLAIFLHTVELLKENIDIKYFITNCYHEEILQLYDQFTEYEVISKGKPVRKGGVKLFGKRYSYVRLKFKTENYLSAKPFLYLITHAKSKLEALRRNMSSKTNL